MALIHAGSLAQTSHVMNISPTSAYFYFSVYFCVQYTYINPPSFIAIKRRLQLDTTVW